jgi:hypothetical protein
MIDFMKRLEAKRQFSAVAQMGDFGSGKSKMLYLSMRTLSATALFSSVSDRSNRQQNNE